MADKAEAKAAVGEEEILKTDQSPEASVTFLGKMNDKEESKVAGEEEKRLKRKQSLEASVTLGLGCGKKKKRHVEAFYSAVWPALKEAGWTLAKGDGDEEGATYFLPPGVIKVNNKSDDKEDDAAPQSPSKENPTTTHEEGPWECKACGHKNIASKSRCTGSAGEGRCMAWRGGKRLRKSYFSRVRDVIERVLEKKNEVEANAADAFLELVPNAFEAFVDKKEKKSEGSQASPPRDTRQNNELYAWKEERTHYEKSSSRVGSEYQVDVLPAPGTYTAVSTDAYDGGALYERVWDPKTAEKSGKLDFVHTRVTSSRKESAYDLFHSRGYRLPGFYHEVSKVSSTDCSDWMKEEKDRFRSAMFEHHENMKEVAKMVGKPLSECITYYLVKFKRTKSYKSLKRSMKRKANVTEGSAGTLVCNECGKGGMLIACDTCEAHYHLTCATPPLESIPDGSWNCGNCKRETRSMLSSQDEMSCGTDQNRDEGVKGNSSAKRSRGTEPKESEDSASETPGGCGHKRKLDATVGSTPETDSEESNGSSNHKRMRVVDDTNGGIDVV